MLTGGQIDEFMARGFVRVSRAFSPETAATCCELAQTQLGYSAEAPWPEPVLRGPVAGPAVRQAARSNRLVSAVEQLLAGERWHARDELGLFVVRFPWPVDPGDTGWHVDAGFEGPETDGIFSWYVNHGSRDRGLLLLCLLSDVGPLDAPTRMLVGSHRRMPALLEPFGADGVMGLLAPLPEPSGEVALATGEAGDVYLCHPLLVHAASWPHRGARPRVLAQTPIAIDGDLRLDAPSHERSVVASALMV
jgi:hypothetical protein